MTADAARTDSTDVIGRRIGAALIDLVLLMLLFMVLGMLIGDSRSGDGEASVSLRGAGALLWLALSLLYYGVAEAATGQTVGKRLLGVRVASVDGSSASAGQVAIRTVLRLIDGIFFYLVGLVCVLATGERRARLGDLAGKTAVVRA